MLDAVLNEFNTVVLWLVESDDMSNSKMLKHFEIVLGSVTMSFMRWGTGTVIDRAHESDELSGKDPVKVTIFYLFVVLIFTGIKVLEGIPSQAHCYFQTLQAVVDLYIISSSTFTYRALISAISIGCISERYYLLMIGLKILLPDGFSVYLKHHDHEGAHQEATVGLLVKLVRAIVVNSVILELWVLYKQGLLSFLQVSMDFLFPELYHLPRAT